MRAIKRLLLLAKELSIFLLGIILSLVLAVAVEEGWDYRYHEGRPPLAVVLLPSLVLFSGVLLTSFVLSWIRRKHGDTADLLRQEFRSNSLTLTCWQWRYSSPALCRQSRNELGWSVACRAPADVYQQQFEASFYGRQESMPDFYRIVEGVSFVR